MRALKFRGKINGNWWYTTPDDENWAQFWALVDRETVGQFVGFNDKHDKEIYESDIVQWEAIGYHWNIVTYTMAVRWDQDQAMFLPNDMKADTEIIDNIHDNPSHPRERTMK